MKNSTKHLIKALRQFARPPFARCAKDDQRMKTNPGPFTGNKWEREARAKALRAERARVGSEAVRQAYRYYLSGWTARANNLLGLPTVIGCYTHST